GYIEVVFGNQLASSRSDDLAANFLVAVTIVGAGLGRLLISSIGGTTAGTRLEHSQLRLGLDLRALLRLDLDQRAICRCDNLENHLVGLDVDQYFVTLDGFAHLLVPGGHSAFLDRLG